MGRFLNNRTVTNWRGINRARAAFSCCPTSASHATVTLRKLERKEGGEREGGERGGRAEFGKKVKESFLPFADFTLTASECAA